MIAPLLFRAPVVARAAILAATLAIATAPQAQEVPPGELPAGSYRIDTPHSTLVFRVSHLGFSWYTGAFSGLDATLEIDPASPDKATLSATVDAATLILAAPPPDGFRDTLLGPEWLDAGAHPEITFQSSAVERTGERTARVTGDLSFRGETRPLTLEVTYNGGYPGMEVYDPNARIGFSATATLKRSDFGMSFGLPPEGTSFGLGDAVVLTIETEFSGPPLKTP